MTMSEAVKEIRFIYHSLESLGISVTILIVVRTSNISTIYMAENDSSAVRTRHIDTRYHFIREHIEGGLIKIIFVRTAKNYAGILSKNVSSETYEKHVFKLLGKMMEDLIVQDRKGIRRYHLYLLYSLRVNTTERRSSSSEEIKLQIND